MSPSIRMERTMKYCNKCGVHSEDAENRCPLCESLLLDEGGESGPSRYPDLELTLNWYTVLKRAYLFFAILIITASIIVDLLRGMGISWSFLSIGVVGYSWTVIYHAIRTNTHFASKILVQAIAGSLLMFVIDYMSGTIGWSVNYVIPQILIFANAAIFVLMLINFMAWREYVFYQLVMTFIGLLPIFLILFNVVTRPVMSYVSVGISAAILVGTVIFGDKTVKSELIRRFHI